MKTYSFPQRAQILWHLQEGRSISKLEALLEYGVGNLGDVIYKLRKGGYNITKEWAYRTSKFGKKKYAKYSMGDK